MPEAGGTYLIARAAAPEWASLAGTGGVILHVLMFWPFGIALALLALPPVATRADITSACGGPGMPPGWPKARGSL
jgi:hypothetical protein